MSHSANPEVANLVVTDPATLRRYAYLDFEPTVNPNNPNPNPRNLDHATVSENDQKVTKSHNSFQIPTKYFENPL